MSLRPWSTRLAVVLVITLITGLTPGDAAAQWLSALQREAVALDPAVSGAAAQVRAAQERVVQARAGFGPTVALTASSNEARYDEAPDFNTRALRARQHALQLTQPLLRSSLLPALESASALLEQAQAQLDQARADATVRLLEACFEALKARDTLALMSSQRLAADEQLASARHSYTVGVATIVEVREAEARIDTVVAQGLAAQADLDLRTQYLTELVGRPVNELTDRSLAADALPALPTSGVLDWLAQAQLRNAQLQAARRTLESAEAEVRKAWHGHAPTLDLAYSYTRSSDTGTVTSVFPRKGNNSQVGVNLNLPLFASGATHSKVRESVALRDKAQSEVDAARRAVQINVRQAYTGMLSAVGLAKGLETATRSLETAMQANRRGAQVGMKVNVDVLEAQTKLFEARRDAQRARYDAWLNYMRLKSLAGQLTEADFGPLDLSLLPAPKLEPYTTRQRAFPAPRAQPQ